MLKVEKTVSADGAGKMDVGSGYWDRVTPSPSFCVSAEYKGFKVICFDTHLQVLIVKGIGELCSEVRKE